MLGLSAATLREAAVGEFRGAAYIGAGPVWSTPSKADGFLIGLDGLGLITSQVPVPVVAIGGVDASNAADCIRVGAAGSPSSAPWPRSGDCGQHWMKLSQLGEFTLAELDRLGLARRSSTTPRT